MSGSEFLAAIGRGWSKPPDALEHGTSRTGVAAALWQETGPSLREVDTEPDPRHHLVSFQMSAFAAETFYDGKLAFAGHHGNGSFNIVPAGVRPRAIIHGAYACLQVVLPVDLFGQVVPDHPSSQLELINPRGVVDPAARRIGSEFLAELQAGQPFARMRMDALGLELAVQILRRWSSLSGTRGLARDLAKGGLAPWQVRRACDYLEDHLADDVTLAELGALLGLSTFHLCRAFKHSTGLPPHRWRHQRRMERGRELLEGTTLPITEIAASVGYDDPSRFAAGFRKAFGLSPTDYRRERRW